MSPCLVKVQSQKWLPLAHAQFGHTVIGGIMFNDESSSAGDA